MELAQFEKHSEVIKWYCDNLDKGVWACLDPGATVWELTCQPSFAPQHFFIQNDQYADLRKALADGKVIQLNNRSGYAISAMQSWITVDRIADHIPVTEYRIKPDEFKPKPGEWIEYNENIYQIDKYQAQGLSFSSPTKGSITCLNDMKNVKLWKPKVNDYICYKVKDNRWIVCQYTDSMWQLTDILPLIFLDTLKEGNSR